MKWEKDPMRYAKQRKPHQYLNTEGEHHCPSFPTCEWYYDGRTAERAYPPFKSVGMIDMDEVNRRIEAREREEQSNEPR